MVSRNHKTNHPQRGQTAYAPAKFVQHLFHKEPCLVLVFGFFPPAVDLLRCDKDYICIFDFRLTFLGGFDEIVKLAFLNLLVQTSLKVF